MVDGVNFFQNRLRKLDIGDVDILFKLFETGRADDGACDKPAAAHKCDRHRRRTKTVALGEFDISRGRKFHVGFVVALTERWEQSQARAFRFAPFRYLPVKCPNPSAL